jgi:F420-0:gamma-glutamyl ligase
MDRADHSDPARLRLRYAGVDASTSGNERCCCSSRPDESAYRIHKTIVRDRRRRRRCGLDTFGWRTGYTEVAIGVAGMPIIDYVGQADAQGREMSDLICVADELASAAELVTGGEPGAGDRSAATKCQGRGLGVEMVRQAETDIPLGCNVAQRWSHGQVGEYARTQD